jgi:hypothetical protein
MYCAFVGREDNLVCADVLISPSPVRGEYAEQRKRYFRHLQPSILKVWLE